METVRRSALGFLLLAAAIISPATPSALAKESSGGGGRSLLGFRQTKGNASFHCSPSGPCLPCQYSEKKDEKYHCSETGYRVPLNCVEIQENSKEETSNKKQRQLYSHHDHDGSTRERNQLLTAVRKLKWRRLLDAPSTTEAGKQSYITYRSCVPVEGEEKLSVIGFEVLIFGLLLISGSVVYMKQKRGAVMPGVIRLPSSSLRF